MAMDEALVLAVVDGMPAAPRVWLFVEAADRPPRRLRSFFVQHQHGRESGGEGWRAAVFTPLAPPSLLIQGSRRFPNGCSKQHDKSRAVLRSCSVQMA